MNKLLKQANIISMSLLGDRSKESPTYKYLKGLATTDEGLLFNCSIGKLYIFSYTVYLLP